jgi:hypothetical protein
MRVGIVTPYQRHWVSFAAVQLAQALLPDAEVTILTPTANPAALHPAVDGLVLPSWKLSRSKGFTSWFSLHKPDLVIWTRCPGAAQVDWVRSAGRRSLLLAYCGEEDHFLEEVYPLFDRVVAPSLTAARLLTERYAHNNVVACPWSPVRLPQRKAAPRVAPDVYVPLYGPYAAALRPAVIGGLARLIGLPGVRLTVSHDSSTLPFRRELRTLERASGGRMSLAPAGDYTACLLRMGRASLTVVVEHADAYGMGPLCSAYMGTPAFTWDCPVAREFISPGLNGFLVADRASMPRFFEILAAGLAIPGTFSVAPAALASRLAQRRAQFSAFWGGLLRNLFKE